MSSSKKPRALDSAAKSESPDLISSKTPEKSSHFSRRTRNRGVLLSVKEVREVAESLQDRRAQNVKPVRRKIASSFGEVSPRKSKAVIDKPVKLPEK